MMHFTVGNLCKDGIHPRIVVEPHEADAYRSFYDDILVIPKSHQGISYVRNWIKEHAISEGYERHWQLDDNIRYFKMVKNGERLSARPSLILGGTETLVDRYENVAIAGIMNSAFGHKRSGPFSTNKMVYCAVLVRSDDYRWDEELNGIEDVDYSLQVVTSGVDCTILVRAFQIEKVKSGYLAGGNTDLYTEDGRLERTRALQRKWPGIVRVERMWGRTRHNLNHVWRRFDTPLIKKEGID